ncbi:MAG: tetratricopeptide repeat protein [Acidobacteriota bacterium]
MRATLALALLLLSWQGRAMAVENRPIAINQTLESRVDKGDVKGEGAPLERWESIGRIGQPITIEMNSDEFDPVLRLLGANGNIIASDDNSGPGLNARIFIKLPQDGRYYIEAAAIWQQRGGRYRLSVVEGETPVKTGMEKLNADLEYFERLLRAAPEPAWMSELQIAKLARLLELRRDADALKAAETAVTVAQKAGDKFALAKAYFTVARGLLRDDEYQRALPYLEQALMLQREIQDRASEAVTINALADAYQAVDEPEKALDYYQQTLVLRREEKDRRGEGLALFGIAQSYRFLNRPKEALANYEQALACSRETNNRAGEGYSLLGLADCYRVLEQYERALPFYEKALAVSREIKERTLEAVTLAAVADGYRFLGDCTKAVTFYEQTLAIRRELKDRRGEAYTLNGMAQCLRTLGQLPRAISNYQQMLLICREIKDRRGEAIALSGLGMTYRTQTNLREAVDVYEKSLAVLREIKDRRGEYNALIGIAAAYRTLAQYDRALPYLEQALAMNDANSELGSIDPLLTALSAISYARGQYEKSAEYAIRVRELKRTAKDKNGEAIATLLLATSQRALNSAAEAQSSYQQALVLFGEAKEGAGEYSCYYGLAELARQLGNWRDVQNYFESALRSIETNPGVLPPREPLPGFITPTAIYQNYVDALTQRQLFTPALAVAERALVYNLYTLNLAAGTTNKTSGKGPLRLAPATVEDIQQVAVRLNTTVVELMPTQKGLTIWMVKPAGGILGQTRVIKPGQLETILTEWRAALEPKNMRIEKLREALGMPAVTESVSATNGTEQILAQLNLKSLYELFFPDTIAAALPTEKDSRLLIIAPGRLATVPFTDLRDEQGRPLIERLQVFTAPSVSLMLDQSRRRDNQPHAGSLVIGDPIATMLNGRPFPELNGTREELKAVAEDLKTKFIKGEQVTKMLLREQASGKQYVHLIAYAYMDDQQPLESALILSPEINEQGQTINNGLLTAGELQSWELNTDLIVIPAVQAGFSPTTGEGLAAFSHSLMLAGCASAVYTLWNVDPNTTILFAKNFYERLKKSNDVADSFRKAVLKTREKYKEPSQWAAFVLVGEPVGR